MGYNINVFKKEFNSKIVKKIIKKKAYVNKYYCVGCGTCVKVCPLNTITVPNGITAKVDFDKCVGCGKCSSVCPATTINILEMSGGTTNEKEKTMV